MNDLMLFDFEKSMVRVVLIDGVPWWVAKDVAGLLGYSDTVNAIKQHCKGVAKHHPIIDAAGREQTARVIDERDLYRLIMRSRLPEAERFEEWVVGEVLPQIRKTGGYGLPRTFADALQLAADQARRIEQQERELLEAAPKVEFYEQVAGSKDAIDMKNAAKVLNMGMGRNKLFAFLREQDILMRDNMPYQEYIDRGYFRVIEQSYQRSNGEWHVSRKTVVYQRGLDYIRKIVEKAQRAIEA
ncbi:MAG: phage antirepressor [Spirochaetota bacterium]